MQLVLHADVGERLLGRTVTDYRNIQIEAIDPVLESTIWPPAVSPTRVTLAPGEHTLEVTGGQAGSVMSAFEPLQDCFRYDDQTDVRGRAAARRSPVTRTTRRSSSRPATTWPASARPSRTWAGPRCTSCRSRPQRVAARPEVLPVPARPGPLHEDPGRWAVEGLDPLRDAGLPRPAGGRDPDVPLRPARPGRPSRSPRSTTATSSCAPSPRRCRSSWCASPTRDAEVLDAGPHRRRSPTTA